MTDLQCPATIVLIPSASLGSSACRHTLEHRRMSGLYVADADVVDHASLAAIANDLDMQRVETGSDREAFKHTLDSLADQYRGETIALVASGEVLRLGLGLDVPLEEPLVLSVDSSGWAFVPSR